MLTQYCSIITEIPHISNMSFLTSRILLKTNIASFHLKLHPYYLLLFFSFPDSLESAEFIEIQKTAQLSSILKKPSQACSSQSPSVLILQPSQHLNKEMPIELSNLKYSKTKCSTLPRPPPPPRIPSPDSIATSTHPNQKITCTLDRRHCHLKEFDNLHV